MGMPISVISAEDLTVCKAQFNRPRDWLDIEIIFRVRERLDVSYILYWLNEFREPDDERIRRIEVFFETISRETDRKTGRRGESLLVK
ncbi:MAG TPA: hypothetical protein VFD32_15815 [Dehalococcoidia bacterium]|nr:hypothetical protein [Dehalococcoidia bacterium]